jgi:hypothetical protein
MKDDVPLVRVVVRLLPQGVRAVLVARADGRCPLLVINELLWSGRGPVDP